MDASRTTRSVTATLDRMQVATSAVIGERASKALFLLAAVSVIAMLLFIVVVLVQHSIAFFGYEHVTLTEFLTSTHWEPIDQDDLGWGIWPLLTATLLIAFGATLIGLPIGLATAIYLAEYAHPRVRATLKPTLELLAGIPSIVFGFFAIQAISPIWVDLTTPGATLYEFTGGAFYDLNGGPARVFNAMNAIVVVGIMVIPIIASLSEDAIRSVPRHLREASLGVGATKWETTRKVVLPAAISGITASVVLAVARAIGETMAVTLAAGTQANFVLNPFESVLTMTAYIAQTFGTEQPLVGATFDSMFAVGLALFTMTLILNLVAQRFVKKFREVETQ